jgi:hypothetical protein
MACLRVAVLPEFHAAAGRSSTAGNGGVHVEAARCVGLGRGWSVESGKVFFKGEYYRRPLGVRNVRREVTTRMALSMDDKISTGGGGAVLEDVPHLTDWLPDLPVSV